MGSESECVIIYAEAETYAKRVLVCKSIRSCVRCVERDCKWGLNDQISQCEHQPMKYTVLTTATKSELGNAILYDKIVSKAEDCPPEELLSTKTSTKRKSASISIFVPFYFLLFAF